MVVGGTTVFALLFAKALLFAASLFRAACLVSNLALAFGASLTLATAADGSAADDVGSSFVTERCCERAASLALAAATM